MRRLASFLAAIGVLVAVPGVASAKGSDLAFDPEEVRPGARVEGRAGVGTWPGSGGPEDGPFAVYLVKGSQELWYRHLPGRAIEVGGLEFRRKGAGRYAVQASFRVPRTEPGTYSVWVCNEGCRTGFGDLVGGSITVAGENTPPPAAEDGGPRPVAREPGTSRTVTVWLLAAVLTAASAFAVWRTRARSPR
ncbi:MAG: hypothetical protein WD757_03280 [Actinomycetota bacterium]